MKRVSKQIVSALLTGILVLTLLTGIPAKDMAVVQAAATIQNPRIGDDGSVTWDCIYFGRYPQSDATGETDEPIKWRVLSVDGDDAFLVADQNLDVQKYNETYDSVTWETCTIRSWLNGYGSDSNNCEKDYTNDNFIDRAFSDSEKEAIRVTELKNLGNPLQGGVDQNPTKDKVFLLSYDEVTNADYGFSSDSDKFDDSRKRKNTAYVAVGGTTGVSQVWGDGEIAAWLLRSPGENTGEYQVMKVDQYGYASWYGCRIDNNVAVCPALRLNLSALDNWSYAGTVSVEGKKNEQTVSTTLRNPRIDSEGVVTWDCIYFGRYPQSDEKGKKSDPIKWRVLSVDGNDAFLIADQNLDVQRYNETLNSVTWETCTLRSWLNGYGSDSNVCKKDYTSDSFIKRAFTDAEQRAIKTTDIINLRNPQWKMNGGGNNTQDKIFLLSYTEAINAKYGFCSASNIWKDNKADSARKRTNTAYTATGGSIGSVYMNHVGGVNPWWLRTPGSAFRAMYASRGGYIGSAGDEVGSNVYAVCPALHLDLSATDLWYYADSVSTDSDNDGEEKNTESKDSEATEQPVQTSLGNPQTDRNGYVTWDCVYFGRYPQSDATGQTKDPIKWRVLSVAGNDAFLVADQNLDVQSYNDKCVAVAWETCTLRSWLNGYGSESNKSGKDYTSDNFINCAFNDQEQELIKRTDVVQVDNPWYGTDGGNNTQDKIFLLSYSEVMNTEYGFSSEAYFKENKLQTKSDDTRKRTNTAFVAAGGSTGASSMKSEGEFQSWLLRTLGSDASFVMNVQEAGTLDGSGGSNNSLYCAICPALHLDLSATDVWDYAGKVTTNPEGVQEEEEEVYSDDVSLITYTPVARTCEEQTGGKTDTDADGKEYYRYDTLHAGDKLTVIRENGTIEGYTCELDESTGYYTFVSADRSKSIVCSEENDVFSVSDAQDTDHWGVGKHTVTVQYSGATCTYQYEITKASRTDNTAGQPTTTEQEKTGKPTSEESTTTEEEKTEQPTSQEPTTTEEDKTGNPTSEEPTTTEEDKTGNPSSEEPTTTEEDKTGNPTSEEPTTEEDKIGNPSSEAATTEEQDKTETPTSDEQPADGKTEEPISGQDGQGEQDLQEHKSDDSRQESTDSDEQYSLDQPTAGQQSGTTTSTEPVSQSDTDQTKVVANQTTDLKYVGIALSKTTLTYDGTEKKPELLVRDGDKTLKENEDYTLQYRNNRNAGTASVIITGKDSYTGQKELTFTIEPYDVSGLSKELKGKDGNIYQTPYTKKPIRVTTRFRIAVSADGEKRYLEPKENEDYTYTYKNNTNIGTASIIYTFNGNYKGTLVKNFQIVPPASKLTAVKKSGNTIKLKWKTVSSCDRYEVYRATSQNGTYKKIATVKGKKTCTYKDRKAKKGKKYYYYVKACKSVKGTIYRSTKSNIRKGKR